MLVARIRSFVLREVVGVECRGFGVRLGRRSKRERRGGCGRCSISDERLGAMAMEVEHLRSRRALHD